MTFTLVSHLREQLSTFVHAREESKKEEEREKERVALEVSQRRFFPLLINLKSRWGSRRRKHELEGHQLRLPPLKHGRPSSIKK